MRVAHLSDLHLRNLKYYDQYKETILTLLSQIRLLKPDLIIFSGDLFHTKILVTGESISLARMFLKGLSEIAPVHMILGNHDALVRNKDRISAVIPLVEEFPNICLYTNSGFYPLKETEIVFAVYSVLDENKLEFSPSNLDPNKIYFGMYHGCVQGSKNKFGHQLETGNTESSFNGLDYVFLGDIHEAQTIDEAGKIRYPGSLLQNNHGESSEKGFLLWDIKSKTEFDVSFHKVESPLKFVTIELEPDGTLHSCAFAPEGCFLRLISNNFLSVNVMREAIDEAKRRFKPKALTFFDRALSDKNKEETTTLFGHKENLRDPVVQEKMIRAYLENFSLDEDMIQQVLQLNAHYSSIAESKEEIARNVFWSIEKVEWDNLFNYGESNSIDFTKLSGIVGILGKNYIGKSSAMDVILFTLFNSISKNARKNLYIVNQTKDYGRGKVTLQIGKEKITIERTVEKYKRTLKGVTTVEAKTDVEIVATDIETGETNNYNGIERSDTDKNIRKLLGTLEDFLLVSMTSQLDSLAFIKEGSTKRKEILAKFLDLEVFDKKYQLAKEDFSELRSKLKDLEDIDFDEEIGKVSKDIYIVERNIEEQKRSCSKYEELLREQEKELHKIELEIAAAPVQMLNKDEINQQIQLSKSKIESFEKMIEENESKLQKKKDSFSRITQFLQDNKDIGSLKQTKSEIREKAQQASELTTKESYQVDTISRIEKKIELLKEVPCGDDYKDCKFIKDAFGAKAVVRAEKQELTKIRDLIASLTKEIQELDENRVDSQIKKYEEIQKKKQELEVAISSLELSCFKVKSELDKEKDILSDSREQSREYYKNEKTIKALEKSVEKNGVLQKEISKTKMLLGKCNDQIILLHQRQGSNNHILATLKDQQTAKRQKRRQYASFDYYLNCMHVNGIANSIIKDKLPTINNEIQKILSNVVNFQVFLELEDNKLDIMIKHPKYEARYLEMGSGAEKTLAAMAIRLALLNTTTLPISDIFILDEPAVSLDADNLDGFVKILEVVKGYFKSVILITHIEALRDIVDEVIEIEKDSKGCAKIAV